MPSSSTHQCKWGILSTGWIAQQFTHDLLIDPRTRGTEDIEHKIVAVASRSKEKADKFVKENFEAGQHDIKDVKTYGSYSELYNDKVRASPTSFVRFTFGANKSSFRTTCLLPLCSELTAFCMRSILAVERRRYLHRHSSLSSLPKRSRRTHRRQKRSRREIDHRHCCSSSNSG